MVLACVLIVVVLWGAGRWDDLRGDERARGFKGHLGAARGGAVTGGLVKLVAGAAAGLGAAALVVPGWSLIPAGMIVALTANLVNLLDRAPGRAGKTAILIAVPCALFGATAWLTAAAGLFGALIVCLPFDLRARGMLGDAGANPLGGVLGLGIATWVDDWGFAVAVAVLALLNGLSERYSFSAAISRVPLLRALDQLGRPRKARN
jgi:UDP-N-acetylmuramyl pentapeptide phosphotransferase/UDP-N-acetylglucosamine-1-phosphate transferase